ncbi:MAG TPA: PAS domain-containing sensor histidine kinase [Candidatus Limnocylindrales bacterium]|nr:PAS domain-containing sensor histidine kinase [Candidatus Limnocylindrales bacterium]
MQRREFWATQALVLVIASGHFVLELLGPERGLVDLDFIPVSLFLIPVVYAGLNFGLRGAGPTALWCAVLTVPNAVYLHPWPDQLAELWQAGVIVVVGLFVGQRIDREQRARREADRRERARRTSERTYRSLFETTGEPILLIRPDGVIEESNAAAAALFGASREGLNGRHVADLGSSELTVALRQPDPVRVVGLPDRARGGTRWVEPVVTPFGTEPGRIQAVLRDVTAQRARQQGLEAYTLRTLTAREEERRRIARELHDGPVQSLVLLWRKLDELGEGASSASRADLGEARSMAESIAHDLRRFSRDLRPSVLDDLGLEPALRAEVATFAARSGVDARFAARGEVRRLSPEVELTLLRITQEALHNVERHAQARKATVRLVFGRPAVRLMVTDDGRGFESHRDSRSLLEAGKLGLVGMQERARLANAEFTVRSGRRGGTCIIVVAPDSTGATTKH